MLLRALIGVGRCLGRTFYNQNDNTIMYKKYISVIYGHRVISCRPGCQAYLALPLLWRWWLLPPAGAGARASRGPPWAPWLTVPVVARGGSPAWLPGPPAGAACQDHLLGLARRDHLPGPPTGTACEGPPTGTTCQDHPLRLPAGAAGQGRLPGPPAQAACRGHLLGQPARATCRGRLPGPDHPPGPPTG